MDLGVSDKVAPILARVTAFIAEEILMKCPSKYNEKNEMAGNQNSYVN